MLNMAAIPFHWSEMKAMKSIKFLNDSFVFKYLILIIRSDCKNKCAINIAVFMRMGDVLLNGASYLQ